MKTIRKVMTSSLLLLLFCTVQVVAIEIPAKPQDHPIALIGGTIHTMSGGVIENGTIVFDKGKIIAIGTTVDFSPGTEKIDVKGKHIYPGMIDPISNVGLNEIGAVAVTRDVAEGGSINPNIRAEAAVNPESEIIPVTRANGITMAVIIPTGGVIAGTAAVLELDGWTWEDMTFRSPIGMVVIWPQMTISRAWWEQRSEEDQKKERDKALNELRNAFRDARAYLKAKRAENQQGVPRHNVDLRWEAMAPVLDRKIPVLMAASDIQQIQAAVAWAEQENVKMILLGGGEAWRVADLLKAKNIPVIVGPIQTLPDRRWEPYDLPFTLPKKLYDAGVKFCIAGDGDASNERNLPYHAGTAAAFGLPKDEAMKAVTIYTAQIFGLDDRVGALEVGNDATLIVTNGDPLEVVTNVEKEFIRGKDIPLSSKHTRLYEKYKEKYRRMSGTK